MVVGFVAMVVEPLGEVLDEIIEIAIAAGFGAGAMAAMG